MKKINILYDFLNIPLYDWFNDKIGYFIEIIENPLQNVPDSEFLKLNLSREEFKKKFIDPYQKYNYEQIQLISEIQTSMSHLIIEKMIDFAAKPFDSEYLNAIYWTLVNIKNLGLKGLSFKNEMIDEELDVLAGFYEEPYKQCQFCGKPDEDKRGVKFGTKGLKMCHEKTCITSKINGEPEAHDKGCCMNKWSHVRKNFEAKVREVCKVNFTKSDIERRNEKIIEIFEEFCEERFNSNLTMEWTLQTIDDNARRINIPKSEQIIGESSYKG